MIDDRTLEAAARSWLAEGPRRAPSHAVDAALASIEVTAQDRRPWVALRLPRMSPIARAAAAAALAVVVLSGSLYLLDLAPGIGGRPTPAPSPTPSPTIQPSIAPPGTPAPTPDAAACALVTADEAEEIGGTVGLLPSPSGTGNVVTCIYADGGGDVRIRLTLTKTGGDQAMQAIRDTAGVQVVEGQGDEAIFDPAVGTLHVRKGDSLLSISAGRFGDTPVDPLVQGRSIADIAYPRM